MDGEQKTPVLSICMTGRDDDYMLDFRYRIATTLNSYARSLKSLGRMDQAEIMVTDWGSDVPLSKTLALTPEAAEICRFVYVPQEAIRNTQDGKDFFHTTRSCNVAMLRSAGRFVFLTNADQLLPQAALESLLRLLNGELQVPVDVNETLMIVPRLQVPWQFIQREPSLDEWDRYLFFNEHALPRETVPPVCHLFGHAGGFVLHTEMNRRLRGLNEIQSGWGQSDIDYCYRAIQEHPFVFLSNLGISMFHMEHPPTGRHAAAIIAQTNPLRWSSQPSVNQEGWGLDGYDLVEQKAQNVSESARVLPKKQRNGVEAQSGLNWSDEISKEIQDKRTREHVANTLKRFDGSHWGWEGYEMSALTFLAWYGRNRFPHRYLEIGATRAAAYSVVGSACPSVEICSVDSLQGECPGFPPLDIMPKLRDFGLQGRFHLINGPIECARERIKSAFSISGQFDLIYARLEKLAPNVINNLLDLFPSLADGGAIILSCELKTSFDSIWESVKQSLLDKPFLMFKSSDCTAGMVYKLWTDEKHDGLQTKTEKVIDFGGFHAVGNRADASEMVINVASTNRRSISRRVLKKGWKILESIKNRYKDKL